MKYLYITSLVLVTVFAFNKTAYAVCTGNIFTDPVAAQNCATQAQSEAQARGYTASCTVESTGLNFIDPNTGLDHYYNSTCTINGSTGHGAYLLAGYSNPGGQITYVNPGWNTLQVELGTAANNSGGSQSGNTSGGGSTPVVGLSGNSPYLSNAMKLINATLSRILATYNIAVQMPVYTASSSNTGSQAATGSCTVTLSANAASLNIRSAPNTSSVIVGGLYPNQTFAVQSSVIGEAVEGSTKWWKNSSNQYIWAGGTVATGGTVCP